MDLLSRTILPELFSTNTPPEFQKSRECLGKALNKADQESVDMAGEGVVNWLWRTIAAILFKGFELTKWPAGISEDSCCFENIAMFL